MKFHIKNLTKFILFSISLISSISYADNYCSRVRLAQSILSQCIDEQSCTQVCLFVVNTAIYIGDENFEGYEQFQNIIKSLDCNTIVRADNMDEVFAWRDALETSSLHWIQDNCETN